MTPDEIDEWHGTGQSQTNLSTAVVQAPQSEPVQMNEPPAPEKTKPKKKLFMIIGIVVGLLVVVAVGVFAFTMMNKTEDNMAVEVPSPTAKAMMEKDMSDWETYIGNGFTFKYPDSWNANLIDSGIELCPPGYERCFSVYVTDQEADEFLGTSESELGVSFRALEYMIGFNENISATSYQDTDHGVNGYLYVLHEPNIIIETPYNDWRGSESVGDILSTFEFVEPIEAMYPNLVKRTSAGYLFNSQAIEHEHFNSFSVSIPYSWHVVLDEDFENIDTFFVLVARKDDLEIKFNQTEGEGAKCFDNPELAMEDRMTTSLSTAKVQGVFVQDSPSYYWYYLCEQGTEEAFSVPTSIGWVNAKIVGEPTIEKIQEINNILNTIEIE